MAFRRFTAWPDHAPSPTDRESGQGAVAGALTPPAGRFTPRPIVSLRSAVPGRYDCYGLVDVEAWVAVGGVAHWVEEVIEA